MHGEGHVIPHRSTCFPAFHMCQYDGTFINMQLFEVIISSLTHHIAKPRQTLTDERACSNGTSSGAYTASGKTLRIS